MKFINSLPCSQKATTGESFLKRESLFETAGKVMNK